MSEVKSDDELGVFDDLVAGKGWSLAPPAVPKPEAAPKTDAPVVIDMESEPPDSSDEVIELDASQVELGPLRTVTTLATETDAHVDAEPSMKADMTAESEPGTESEPTAATAPAEEAQAAPDAPIAVEAKESEMESEEKESEKEPIVEASGGSAEESSAEESSADDAETVPLVFRASESKTDAIDERVDAPKEAPPESVEAAAVAPATVPTVPVEPLSPFANPDVADEATTVYQPLRSSETADHAETAPLPIPPVARVTPPPLPPSFATSPEEASSIPRASSIPPPPMGRASIPASLRQTSPNRPMPIMPVGRTSVVPPPPPRSTTRGTGTTPPPPMVHASSSAAPEGAASESPNENPFLSPIRSQEDGGPKSLLPPPVVPKTPSSIPSAPKRSAAPPPSLMRTRGGTSRLPPPPPSRTTSPSMAPPPALSGTVPPGRRRTLDSEGGELLGTPRRKRIAAIGAVAAVVLVGFFARNNSSSSPAVVAAMPVTAGIHATAKHDGIKLVLDGKDVGTLPQDLKDLTPGEHQLVFQGDEHYASQTTTITLAPSETKELEFVSLHVTKGSAKFDVKTPGTTLTLVSADERRPITNTSSPVDVDNTKAWTLEATRPGYKTVTLPVTFDDEADKTFVVDLSEPVHAEPAAVAAVAAVETKPSPEPAAEPPAAKVEKPTHVAAAPVEATEKSEPVAKPEPAAPKGESLAAKAPPPAPAAKAQPVVADAKPVAALKPPPGGCTLNINSIPTSKITLDGRLLGYTPKVGVLATAGPHVLMLIADTGRKAMSATCKAGETKTVAVRLQ